MPFRDSYATNPRLCDRVFALLERVFPGVSAARIGAERFGATWESVSTPFVRLEDERVVSHVGLLVLPLHVMGRPVTAGGVHGVATHPDRRGRGHYRALMEELLSHADQRYQTLVLTTAHPEYFEPFGFRGVPERVFTTTVRPRYQPARLRALDLAGPDDRRLLHRLLQSRAPLSFVLGVGPDQAVFAFNEARGTLWYAERLDCLVLFERSGSRLRLFEVIGPRVPSLEDLLEEVGGEEEEAIVFFTPDRLGGAFTAMDHDLAGGDYAMDRGGDNTHLMVRGPFPAEGRPLMLPRSARC